METVSYTGAGFVVLAPLGKRRVEPAAASAPARAAGGTNRVVGILDEGWSPPYFEAMRPFFEERWGPTLETRYWKKPLMSAPAPVPLIDEVALASDAVIVGVGH